MGYYFYTILCYGFRIPNVTNIEGVPSKDWITKDKKGIFVCIPSTFYKFKSIDSVIEQKEKKQGYVTINEVLKSTGLKKKHFEPSEMDIETLLNIKKKYPKSGKLDKWIIEYTWNSYSKKELSKLYLNLQLQIL